jgi:hypothetical protein
MNHISEKHLAISKIYNEPEILTNPEKYFGPNYKTLLNVWIYGESLTPLQRSHYQNLWENLTSENKRKQHENIYTYSKKYRGFEMTNSLYEKEIIVAHLILENGGELYSVPLLTLS